MKNILFKIGVFFLLVGSVVVFVFFAKIIWDQCKILTEETETPEVKEFVSEINTSSESVSNTVENIQIPQVIEGNSSEILGQDANVNYDNVSVGGYLFQQLESGGAEQYIYKAFEKNKEEMKTGKAIVNLGNRFSSLLNESNGDTTLLKQYYQTAVEAYFYDNPEVFYLEPNNMYLSVVTKKYSDGSTNYDVYVSANGGSYLTEDFISEEQVNNAIKQVETLKNRMLQLKTNNTYENIENVHDYLVNSVNYDESLSAPNIYNLYGALINKLCVCEGYAKAFKYVMDAMNIPCVIVVGTGTNARGETERHAWNYVQNNGKWYPIDVTWDDPIVRGGGEVPEQEKRKYFMCSAEQFNRTHTAHNQFSDGGKEFQYPEI